MFKKILISLLVTCLGLNAAIQLPINTVSEQAVELARQKYEEARTNHEEAKKALSTQTNSTNVLNPAHIKVTRTELLRKQALRQYQALKQQLASKIYKAHAALETEHQLAHEPVYLAESDNSSVWFEEDDKDDLKDSSSLVDQFLFDTIIQDMTAEDPISKKISEEQANLISEKEDLASIAQKNLQDAVLAKNEADAKVIACQKIRSSYNGVYSEKYEHNLKQIAQTAQEKVLRLQFLAKHTAQEALNYKVSVYEELIQPSQAAMDLEQNIQAEPSVPAENVTPEEKPSADVDNSDVVSVTVEVVEEDNNDTNGSNQADQPVDQTNTQANTQANTQDNTAQPEQPAQPELSARPKLQWLKDQFGKTQNWFYLNNEQTPAKINFKKVVGASTIAVALVGGVSYLVIEKPWIQENEDEDLDLDVESIEIIEQA